MRCIYCLKTDVPFNGREHVIPQFLGTFSGESLILRDVCDVCNRIFSKLETVFKEDSIEGFIAALFRVRQDRSVCLRKTRMKMTNKLTGVQTLLGRVFPTVNPVTGEVQLLPQVIFERKDGKQQIIFLEGLRDDKGFSNRFKWLGSREFSITAFGQGEDGIGEVIGELRKRGIDRKFNASDSETLNYNGNLEIEFDSRIDRDLQRVIAKIAFNYFSFCAIESGFRDILYEEAFDKIRDFAIRAQGKSPVIVTPHGFTVPGYEGRDYIPFHLLRVFEKLNKIKVELSLFAHCRYEVLIGPYPFRTGNRGSFGIGHQFDTMERKMTQLAQGRFVLDTASNYSLFNNLNGIPM